MVVLPFLFLIGICEMKQNMKKNNVALFQAIQAAKGADASLSGFHVEHRDALVVQFESS